MSRNRYVDPSEFVKPKFVYPEVPKAIPVGTCNKCGGSTRAEEFQSWTKLEGLTKKRVFRCIQHGHRCPSVTITVGQEDESMAKPKVIAQTPEWCARMKAACVKKHIRYQDLGVACGLSESTLAQSLNMHITLSESAQKAVEQAIEDYIDVPVTRKKAPAKAKPKSETQKAFEPLPASLQVSESIGKMADAMAKETQETILRNLEAQEALPPGATVTWGEDPPNPGLIQPSEELVIVDVTGPIEEVYAELVRVGCATPAEAGDMLDKEAEKQPLGSVERRLLASAGNYYDLVQRHKALECRVQGVAERAEERINFLIDEQAAAAVNLEDRFVELTEHMANLQPLVVGQRQEQDDALTYWIDERPLTPDRMVQELSAYTDSQLQALVTAATARRDLLKAMEAA